LGGLDDVNERSKDTGGGRGGVWGREGVGGEVRGTEGVGERYREERGKKEE